MRTQVPVLKDLVVIPENVFIVRGKLFGVELEATDVETIGHHSLNHCWGEVSGRWRRQIRIQRSEGDASCG
jgi:hypothetical protein